MAEAKEAAGGTALMRQYFEVKAQVPDAILFFRLGDFYEMFHEDAVLVSRLLSLTLTSRDKGKEDPIPMCGVPHHAARGYLQKLTDLGHRVAICEQLSDPKLTKGIVQRGVVRVVTPGVILDEESLDARTPLFVAGVAGTPREGYGLAFIDVTTGDFRATWAATSESLLDELARVDARELLIPRGDAAIAALLKRAYPRVPQTTIATTDEPAPLGFLREALGAGIDEAALARLPETARAAARVLSYAQS
ncbi:MAG TPA: DNA mismatch repair protein MutS, partial [Polyangia bacterium]